MKQCRTKKDLIDNSYVSHINREYQYGIVDGYDYMYYLYLQNGYWFKEEQTCLISEPTISRLISRFNEMTISKRTNGF